MLNLFGLIVYLICEGVLDCEGGNDVEFWDCGIGSLFLLDDLY